MINRFIPFFSLISGSKNTREIKLWKLIFVLLAIANLAYLPKDFFGWVITLSFFLLAPGYLLLTRMQHSIKSRWEIFSFSLGLSLLILMVSGLALNSLHVFGLARPLTTPNIFASLDLVTLALLVLNRKELFKFHKLHPQTYSLQNAVIVALTLLPLLAIGGAIRINNGASNVLTMVLYAVIPLLFILLIRIKNLKFLYPYAIVMFGMAVLFSTSLRGWLITGHDIQHEFRVFYETYIHGYWTMTGHSGDPYNACLSITILPTILAKITSISIPYIYKIVFQIIFSFSLVPIYLLAKRFGNEQKAFVAGFVFITFPAFFNDMTFLNRQEIAFIFFGLLLLTTFAAKAFANKYKAILTIFLLFGLILSHYSSGYTTLCILVLGWGIYRILHRNRVIAEGPTLPVLRISIIITALLFTFLWNAQVTSSTGNLKGTIAATVKSLVDHTSARDGFVQYSLISTGSQTQSPAQVFTKYAGSLAGRANYLFWQPLPATALGIAISHYINIDDLSNELHSLDAKIFQVLLLLGVALLILRQRKNRHQADVYFSALALSSGVMLILWTILPQISVDYTPIRLFQQTLVITALPIVFAAELLFGFIGKYKLYATALLLALLFLDLSGFIPEITGGFMPQLSLNNSGQYYDFFYTHKSDVVAGQWIEAHKDRSTSVFLDTPVSSVSFLNFPIRDDVLQNGKNGYLLQEYVNVHKGIYRSEIDGMVEFSYPSLTSNRSLVYSNQGSRIYDKQ